MMEALDLLLEWARKRRDMALEWRAQRMHHDFTTPHVNGAIEAYGDMIQAIERVKDGKLPEDEEEEGDTI